MPTYLGIDLGTSGLRGVILDQDLKILTQAAVPYPGPFTNSTSWLKGLETLAACLRANHPQAWSAVRAMTLDGTSGTLLLSDAQGNALAPALPYADQRATVEARWLEEQWPEGGVCLSPASSLNKLVWLRQHLPSFARARFVHHQADWVAAQLTGLLGISDRGNLLKLGIDATQLCYPATLLNVLARADIDPAILPQAVREGTATGRIRKQWAERLGGLSLQTEIRAGCTDSVAAALAAGLCTTGQALTSLGSSLAFKVVHPHALTSDGIYSHLLGDHFLVGAAANAGGAALLRHFQPAAMRRLEPKIHPEYPSGALLYPLAKPGERFPINTALWSGSVIPEDKTAATLQQLLEGLSYIEAWAYTIFTNAGVASNGPVRSTGGGTINRAWMQMRANILNRPIEVLEHGDAAIGAAMLAASADLGGITALGKNDSRAGKLFLPDSLAVQRYAPYAQQFREMYTHYSA